MIIFLTKKNGLEVWVLVVADDDLRTAFSHNAIISMVLSF